MRITFALQFLLGFVMIIVFFFFGCCCSPSNSCALVSQCFSKLHGCNKVIVLSILENTCKGRKWIIGLKQILSCQIIFCTYNCFWLSARICVRNIIQVIGGSGWFFFSSLEHSHLLLKGSGRNGVGGLECSSAYQENESFWSRVSSFGRIVLFLVPIDT